MIRGQLTVCKIYSDGTSEEVFNESNMITAGLTSAFLDIMHRSGSAFAEDYRPRYFQFGTGTRTLPSDDTSSMFFKLDTPLDWAGYGDDSDIKIHERYRGFYASSNDGGRNYEEVEYADPVFSSVVFSGSDEYFAEIREDFVTRHYYDSCESLIVLGNNSGNGSTISEVGLFAKNPKGYVYDSPLLMAYKSFTGIAKTSDFALSFRWNIGYVGISDVIDTTYTGANGTFKTFVPRHTPN